MPTAMVSTSTGPSDSGGSSTSESAAVPDLSGTTVSAFMRSSSVGSWSGRGVGSGVALGGLRGRWVGQRHPLRAAAAALHLVVGGRSPRVPAHLSERHQGTGQLGHPPPALLTLGL